MRSMVVQYLRLRVNIIDLVDSKVSINMIDLVEITMISVTETRTTNAIMVAIVRLHPKMLVVIMIVHLHHVKEAYRELITLDLHHRTLEDL